MTIEPASPTPAPDEASDYTCTIHVDAAPARVVAAVTDAGEIPRWWTAVSGSEREGDEVRLAMGGEWLAFSVGHDDAGRAGDGDVVAWSVSSCAMAPDWVGTTPTFSIRAVDGDRTEVVFRHDGLVPALECYDMCRAGWGHFVPSLRTFLDTGEGLPNEPRLVTA